MTAAGTHAPGSSAGYPFEAATAGGALSGKPKYQPASLNVGVTYRFRASRLRRARSPTGRANPAKRLRLLRKPRILCGVASKPRARAFAA